MNDAINSYIQSYQSFESISFNVSIVLTSIIIIAFIVGFICMFFDLELGKGILAGDASFCIMIAVIYVVLIFFNPITLGPEAFAKDAIQQEYNVETYGSLKQTKIANKDVIVVSVSSFSEKDTTQKHFLFIPYNSKIEYKAYLIKIDNSWQLCTMDLEGNFIPLNPEHTIQDLKEN